MTTDWMLERACRTLPPAMFFPCDSAGVAAAQDICAGCPVRAACLEYALDHGIAHGVWGGSSERQRAKLRAERRRRAPSESVAAEG